MNARVIAIVAGAALAAGCRPKADDPAPELVAGCTLDYLGDKKKPIELELYAAGADKLAQPLKEGGTVGLIVPPQGGWVIFVGARASNIDPCEVSLTGAARDPGNGQLRLDQRTVNLKPIPAMMGSRKQPPLWGGPVDGDISTFANIAMCPNQWAAQGLDGGTVELSISLTDRDGKTATKTANVALSCVEPQFKASCKCQCSKGYKLGQECTVP